MKLKSNNFDGYDFGDDGRLDRVRDYLGRETRIDFLIEDKTAGTMPLIGEAKYYHYLVEGVSRGGRNALDDIQRDYEKLKTFLKYGICKYDELFGKKYQWMLLICKFYMEFITLC
jgi:hypothetical protein